MSIFFTSDLHFGHANVMKHCPEVRPWADVQEMNIGLIDAWNAQVAPWDDVYILGDVSFCKSEETTLILTALQGKKHLVLGNHDHGLNLEQRALFESVQAYLEKKIDDIWVNMLHFPMFQWNKMQYGSFHLYGHVHGANHPEMTGRCMDVGWDAHGRILPWEEIKETLLQKEIRPHHFNK